MISRLFPAKAVNLAQPTPDAIRSHCTSVMSPPNHLIVVCGHAIWVGGPKNGWDEAEWLIEAYKQGETPTFIEHIKAGVQILSDDDSAVLVFSG